MADYAAAGGPSQQAQRPDDECAADWPLALGFFVSVAAMYAVIGYALYLAIG